MGRSVAVPGDASATVYFVFEGEDRQDWDSFIDGIREACEPLKFPKADRWVDRELRVVAENPARGAIVVAEYLGLVSVSLVCRLSERRGRELARTAQKRLDYCFRHWDTLGRVGTASNGEAFFTRS